MRIDAFRKTIKQREYVEEISHGEWADGIEECWKKEVEILAEDIPSTIDFLNNACTATEYSWISEVIDDLAEKTQSRELVDCYKNLVKKFPEESEVYHIAECIQFAEEALREGQKDG